MLTKPRRSSSIYALNIKQQKKDKRKKLSQRQLYFSTLAGAALSLVTFVLHLVAYATPHWKEISPKTHSLYVDGVDALIRTEVLHFFNSVHRFTRHSYGLFQRCEYLVTNSSAYNTQQLTNDNGFWRKKCTKNFLPSYQDDLFDECHSLQYYRFCTKASVRTFDIDINYLRATFDLTSHSRTNPDPTLSCDCHYPLYVKGGQILGAFALIFLFFTFVLYGLFPFVQQRQHRLKIKCFGVLASLLAILFITINLSIILAHIQFESIEYLMAIERHYKLSQIYKLSQDTKFAIDRFLSNVTIKIGYSAILAWITFALSIIDTILFITTCKINDNEDKTTELVHPFSSQNPADHRHDSDNDENCTSNTPLRFSPVATPPLPSPPLPPALPQPPITRDLDDQSNNRPPLATIPTSGRLSAPRREQNYSPRIPFGDEV